MIVWLVAIESNRNQNQRNTSKILINSSDLKVYSLKGNIYLC